MKRHLVSIIDKIPGTLQGRVAAPSNSKYQAKPLKIVHGFHGLTRIPRNKTLFIRVNLWTFLDTLNCWERPEPPFVHPRDTAPHQYTAYLPNSAAEWPNAIETYLAGRHKPGVKIAYVTGNLHYAANKGKKGPWGPSYPHVFHKGIIRLCGNHKN